LKFYRKKKLDLLISRSAPGNRMHDAAPIIRKDYDVVMAESRRDADDWMNEQRKRPHGCMKARLTVKDDAASTTWARGFVCYGE